MNGLFNRRLVVLSCVVLSLAGTAPAGESVAPATAPLRDYKSTVLRVRTDLPGDQAQALYARLERTLKFAARYWERPPRGQIECYVVDDLDNWSDAELPHRLARVIIHGVGGPPSREW